jgi:hypothetical protein
VALDDTATTPVDTAVTIAVLANDTDADGDTLVPSIVAAPTNGTATVNTDGTVLYTPNTGFMGTDTFTYMVNDGTVDSNVATVTVTVEEDTGNEAPVAVDDSATTPFNTPVTISVLDNDTDADGDTLQPSIVADPTNGTAVVNTDGTILFTPNTGFVGAETFTYLVNDGTIDSNVATVTVIVEEEGGGNEAPVAVDDTATTPVDTAVTIAVLTNDTDADGDTLVPSIVAAPTNGTATVNTDGTVLYTPNTGFAGADSFTYMVNDGTVDSNVATVTITVEDEGGNQAPVAVDDTATTPINTGVTITVLANDTDADGDTLVPSIVAAPANGATTVNTDGTVLYTPNSGFIGTDTFTYMVNDGTVDSNVATVTVTVDDPATNSPPVAVDDAATTSPATAVVITVLANDTDADGDTLVPSIVTAPANGTATVNTDGTVLYTPNAGFTGTETFTYQVNDGTENSNVATVTVTVEEPSPNNPPVANNDAALTNPATAVVITVLANDTDADGDPLSVTEVTDPANGAVVVNADGTISYTPDLGFTGTDTFTYRASDGTATSNIATVSVTVGAADFPLSGAPAPGTDTGLSDNDLLTNDNTPTFLGQAPVGFAITLLAVPSSGAPAAVVGTAVAGANGSYSVTANVVADGIYTFQVRATDPNAASTTRLINVGAFAIDTQGPQVASVNLLPGQGRIRVTFTDVLANLDETTLLDPANYDVRRFFFPSAAGSEFPISRIRRANDQSIDLILRPGRRLMSATYLVTVASGGVRDRAGNPLDGEFNGGDPSGDGVPGGAFMVRLGFDGRRVFPPMEVPPEVAAQVPLGPLALLQRAARRLRR